MAVDSFLHDKAGVGSITSELNNYLKYYKQFLKINTNYL